MSLFLRENPLSLRKHNESVKNSLLYPFNDEFFNHPLMSLDSLYPYYFDHPSALEKQISKEFEKGEELLKSVSINPKVNLSEDEKNYYIHADVPGLNKDQLKMELSEDHRLITISGERKTVIDHSNGNENENEPENKESNENKKENKKESHNKKYSRVECSYGKFSRTLSIPENVDINSIQAKLENGVLEISIPKLECPNQEPKRIQIQ